MLISRHFIFFALDLTFYASQFRPFVTSNLLLTFHRKAFFFASDILEKYNPAAKQIVFKYIEIKTKIRYDTGPGKSCYKF